MSNLSIATGMPVSGGEEGFLRKTSTGTLGSLKSNLNATVDPTSLDGSSSGYSVGSRWINVSTDKVFECVDSTVLAAVWKDLSSTSNPGGSSGQFQINNAGLFDGIAGSSFSLGVATLPNLAITDLTPNTLTFAGASGRLGAVTGSSVSGANVTLGGNLQVASGSTNPLLISSNGNPYGIIIRRSDLTSSNDVFLWNTSNRLQVENADIKILYDAPALTLARAAATSIIGLSNTTNHLITGDVANDLSIRTSGGKILFSTDLGTTAHLVINGNGNVLIGNTTGTNKLDVTGTGRFSSATSTLGSTVVDQSGTSGASRISQYNGAGTLKNLFSANGDSYIQGGNFGIGELPIGKLTISAPDFAVAPALSLRQSVNPDYGFDFRIDNSLAVLRLDTVNATSFSVNPAFAISRTTGNVGIGTTAPGAHLYQVIPAATTVGHRVDGHGSQGSTNLAEWNPNGVTAGTRARITSDGYLSSPTIIGATSFDTVSGGATTFSINGVSAIKLDNSSAAGETRLQVFDVDTGILKRVRSATVPPVGSKVLYVDP